MNTLNGLDRTVKFMLSCVTDDGQCLPFVPFVLTAFSTATVDVYLMNLSAGHVANVKRSLKPVKTLKCFLDYLYR